MEYGEGIKTAFRSETNLHQGSCGLTTGKSQVFSKRRVLLFEFIIFAPLPEPPVIVHKRKRNKTKESMRQVIKITALRKRDLRLYDHNPCGLDHTT